eukprot:464571-Amphidinium_carterae.2
MQVLGLAADHQREPTELQQLKVAEMLGECLFICRKRHALVELHTSLPFSSSARRSAHLLLEPRYILTPSPPPSLLCCRCADAPLKIGGC